MKICFVADNIYVKNGWGRSVFNLVTGVKKTGEDVLVLVRESTGLDFEKEVLYGNFLSTVLRIRRHIKNCDVVNVHDVWPYGFFVYLANLGLGKKVVVTAHGTYSLLPFHQKGVKGWLKKKLAKLVLKKVDKIVSVSRYTARQINKFLPELDIKVVYWGVDLRSDNLVEDNKTKELAPYILSVGAIKERKGYHISIPAFAKISKKYSDLKYVIVGPDFKSGSYKKRLEKIIDGNNLRGRVLFLKDLSDKELVSFYENSEFFVLTPVNEMDCIFEGFGLVYLEAGLNKKAVIGVFDCGAEDAIENKITGTLVPQSNIEKTAEVMERFLENKSLTQKFGQQGFLHAKEMTWEKSINKYLNIFKDL